MGAQGALDLIQQITRLEGLGDKSGHAFARGLDRIGNAAIGSHDDDRKTGVASGDGIK